MERIHQYLTFVMKGEQYALSVSHVKEVVEVPHITHIPRMPDFMRGVINLRGLIIPVIDLMNRFGMAPTTIISTTAIIVIEIPRDDTEETGILTVGILADSVHKVVTIEPEAIKPPPKIGCAINTSFIEGMGHVADAFIVILDIAELVSSKKLAFVDDQLDGIESDISG